MSPAKITIRQVPFLKSGGEVPYFYTALTWNVLPCAALQVLVTLFTTMMLAGCSGAGGCGTLGCGTVGPKFLVTDTAGKQLFIDNCAGCHNTLKDATGPALQPALMTRPPGFLQTHLRSYQNRSPDSMSKRYLEIFAPMKCSIFPALDSMEVAHIRRYVLQI